MSRKSITFYMKEWQCTQHTQLCHHCTGELMERHVLKLRLTYYNQVSTKFIKRVEKQKRLSHAFCCCNFLAHTASKLENSSLYSHIITRVLCGIGTRTFKFWFNMSYEIAKTKICKRSLSFSTIYIVFDKHICWFICLAQPFWRDFRIRGICIIFVVVYAM